MRLACKSVLTLAALLAGTGTALAAVSPVGQWTLTGYGEPSLTSLGSFAVCFKADHTWYSPDNNGLKGSWFGEGEELRWYGTGGPGSFAIATHDHFVRKPLMSGVLDAFDPATGQTFPPPANTPPQRVKLTCAPPPPAAAH